MSDFGAPPPGFEKAFSEPLKRSRHLLESKAAGVRPDMSWVDWSLWGADRFGELTTNVIQTGLVDLPVGAYNLLTKGTEYDINRDYTDVRGMMHEAHGAIRGRDIHQEMERLHAAAVKNSPEIAGVNLAEVARSGLNSAGHLAGAVTGLPMQVWKAGAAVVNPIAQRFIGHRLTGMATRLGVADTAAGAAVMARNGSLFPMVVKALAKDHKLKKAALEWAAGQPGLTAGFMAEAFLRGGPIAGEHVGDSITERTKEAAFASVFSVGLWWAQRAAQATESAVLKRYLETGKWNERVAANFAAVAGGSVEAAGFSMMDTRNFWAPMMRLIHNGDTAGLSTMIGEFLGNAAFLSVMRGHRLRDVRRMEPESEELAPEWIKRLRGERDPVEAAVENIAGEGKGLPQKGEVRPESALYEPVPKETAEAWDTLAQSGWRSKEGKGRGQGVFTLPGWRGKITVSTSDAPAELHGGQVRVEVPADMVRRIEPDYKGKKDRVYIGEEAVDAIEKAVLIAHADAARGRLHFSRKMTEETDKPGIWTLPFATQEMVFRDGKIRYRQIGEKNWETMKKEEVTKLEMEAIEAGEPIDQLTAEALNKWDSFLSAHIAASNKITPDHIALEAALKAAEYGRHTDLGVQELRSLISDPVMGELMQPANIRELSRAITSVAAGVGNADWAVERAAVKTDIAAREAAAPELAGEKPKTRQELEAERKDLEGPISERAQVYMRQRKAGLREQATESREGVQKKAQEVQELREKAEELETPTVIQAMRITGGRKTPEVAAARKARGAVEKGEGELAQLQEQQAVREERARSAGERELSESIQDLQEATREINQKIRNARQVESPDQRKIQRLQAERGELESIQQSIRHEMERQGQAKKKTGGTPGLLMAVGPESLGKISKAIADTVETMRGLTDLPGAEVAQTITRQMVRMNLGQRHKAEFMNAVDKTEAMFKKLWKRQPDWMPIEIFRKKKFTAKQMKDAIFIAQKTGNLEGESLQALRAKYAKEKPELLKYIDEVRPLMDRAFDQLVEYQRLAGGEGDLNYIENYLWQIYRKPGRKKAGVRAAFSREFSQVKKRRFASYLEAYTKYGLEPLYESLPELVEHTMNSIATVGGNRVMVDTLMSTELADGRYIIQGADLKTGKKPEGYDRIDHPAMRFHGEPLVVEGGKVLRKEGMKQLYSHPDATAALKKVLDGTGNPGVWLNRLYLLNQGSKQINLMASFFHPGALMESLFGGFLSPIMYGRRPPSLGKLNPLVAANEGLRMLKAGKLGVEIEEGLRIGAPEDTSRYALDRFIGATARAVETKGGPLGKILSVGSVRVIRAIKKKWDAGLWDYLHPGFKGFTANMLTNLRLKQLAPHFEKRGEVITEEVHREIARDVAKTVNNWFGGQAWELYWRMPNWVPKWGQLAMLAPDWFASIFKSGVMGIGAWTPMVRKGKYGGVSYGLGPEHTRAAYRGSAILMTIGAFILNDIAQFLGLSYSPWVSDEDRKKILKQNGSFHVWDNDYGKKDKILSPFGPFNEKGQKVYFGPWKQITEWERLIFDPARYFTAKSSPTVRTLVGLTMDHTPTGFPQPWKDKEYWPSFHERLTHLMGENFVPFSFDFDTQFALTYPKSTGMSNYRSTEFFEKVLQNWGKTGDESYLNELGQIAKATKNNNLDPRNTFSEALRRARGAAHIALMDAVNRDDKEDMDRVAQVLVRYGVTASGAERSMIRKYEELVATGQAEVSPEQIGVAAGKLRGRHREGDPITEIRAAMQRKLLRSGAPYGGGREEVRKIHGLPVSDILSQARQTYLESGFRDRRALQNASLEAADYVIRHWRDAAPELLPARKAALWSRLADQEKRRVLGRYFYRERLLPASRADRRRLRRQPRKEARESELRRLVR